MPTARTEDYEGHKLTPKQSVWLNELIDIYQETGEINGTQAALRAYDTDNYKSATVIGSENKKKLRVPMAKALAKKGVDADYLADKLVDLLNAKQKQVLRHKGELKVIEEDDNATQRYMFKMAAELADLFPSKKLDITTKEDKTFEVKFIEDTSLKEANEPIEGEVVEDEGAITTLIDED